MGKVRYSPAAVADLRQLVREVELVSGSKRLAAGYVNALLDRVEDRAKEPEVCRHLTFKGAPTGYCYVAYKAYVVFYRLVAGDVYADRILPARSDYLRVLGIGAEKG